MRRDSRVSVSRRVAAIVLSVGSLASILMFGGPPALANHGGSGVQMWTFAAGSGQLSSIDLGSHTVVSQCVPAGAANGRGLAYDANGVLWHTSVTGGQPVEPPEQILKSEADGRIHKVSPPPACASLGSIPFGDGDGGTLQDDIGAMDFDPDDGTLWVAGYDVATPSSSTGLHRIFRLSPINGAVRSSCSIIGDPLGNDTLAVAQIPGLPGSGKYLLTDGGEFFWPVLFAYDAANCRGGATLAPVGSYVLPKPVTGIDFEGGRLYASQLGAVEPDGSVLTFDLVDLGPPPFSSVYSTMLANTLAEDVTVAPCAIKGTVLDGNDVADGHAEKVPYALMELRTRPGGDVIRSTRSEKNGTFCLAAPAGNYDLRVTLADGRSDTPMLETKHGLDLNPVQVTFALSASDFDGVARDFELSQNGSRSIQASIDPARVHQVAAIHVNAMQFVEYLQVINGGTDNQDFKNRWGELTIRAFSSVGTSYHEPTSTVFIDEAGSAYSDRDQVNDNGPDNAEYHEIAHHFGAMLSIGDQVPIQYLCAEIASNHGGWNNGSTCDSMREGFATFMGAMGRRIVSGYTDGGYGGFGSIEAGWIANHFDGAISREDLAIASVLWDLFDAPSDTISGRIVYRTMADRHQFDFRDNISIDIETLLQILSADGGVDFADELRNRLATSPLVPQPNRDRTHDLDATPSPPDISDVDAIFLGHAFHVQDPREAVPLNIGYKIGSIVARTDHVALPPEPAPVRQLVPRSAIPHRPGSAVRLHNPTRRPVAMRIQIRYPHAAIEYDLSVPPGGQDVAMHLPPAFEGFVAPGDTAPCLADRVVRVSITTASQSPLRFTNCDYERGIRSAAGRFAITYGIDAPPRAALLER